MEPLLEAKTVHFFMPRSLEHAYGFGGVAFFDDTVVSETFS